MELDVLAGPVTLEVAAGLDAALDATQSVVLAPRRVRLYAMLTKPANTGHIRPGPLAQLVACARQL